MSEFFKLDKGSIAFYENWSTAWFAHRDGCLREAEEAVKFGKNTYGAEPCATVGIEFGIETSSKRLYRR
jgi:hypothetical protein